MDVRFLAVVAALGLGSSLAGCGSTKKQNPIQPAACTAANCPQSCDASGKFCFEREVWKCGADGKSATVLEACAEDEQCQDAGQLTRCEAAPPIGGGMGGAPSISCTPEVRQCGQGQVLICSKDGDSLRLYDTCQPGEVCDETTLMCGPLVCEPGALGCNGTKLAECNASGTALVDTGSDCLTDGQACEAGECVALVCTPLAKSCRDKDVLQCDSAGLHDVAIETCGLYQHCMFVPASGAAVSSAYCSQNSCQPGEKVCAGNLVKTCADDGTLPVEGTDCGQELCVNGVCQPQICEPSARLCVEDQLHECVYPGVYTQLVESCGEAMHCAVLGSGAACAPFPCEAGDTVCLGNAIGTCAADGESLSAVTLDCATTQQVCSSAPTCVASVVDTLGVAEKVDSFSSNEVFGNIIDVHSNRQLTKLEANLVLESARDLRWVVYELTDQGFFEQRAMEITSNNTGSAMFSSSELTWSLEAGKRYMLGVGLVVFEGFSYYDEEPYDSTVSFGKAVGGTRNGYDMEMYFDVNAPLYRIRITTELP